MLIEMPEKRVNELDKEHESKPNYAVMSLKQIDNNSGNR